MDFLKGNNDNVERALRDIGGSLVRLRENLRSNANVSKVLRHAELAVAPELIYTAPITGKCIIKDINVCNTNAGPALFYLSAVEPGFTEGVNQRLYHNWAIAGNTTYFVLRDIELDSTWELYAFADMAGVNIHLSGLEITTL